VRLVVDTCVVASAFRSPHGASRALVDAFQKGRFLWLLSNSLLTEYEAVLKRPEQMRVHGLLSAEIDEFLSNLVRSGTRVGLKRRIRPQLRDAGDELVLESAVNGEADAIVTHNVRDFLPGATRFFVSVLTPGEVLKHKISV
jgi:putative PIN family toxin of toxin-antitoxin system